MNHNEQNRNEQKERIMKYAFNEFVTKGLKAVKVDDIAAAMGMSKRTLYEFFGDKEGLLIECMKYNHEQRRMEFEQMRKNSKNALETLTKLYHVRLNEVKTVNPAFLSDIKKYEELMAYLEKSSEEKNEFALTFIDECVKDGMFRNDIDYNLLLNTFEILCRSILDNELYKQYDFENILNTVNLTFVRGVCTAKGLEVVDSNEYSMLQPTS